MSTVLLVGAGAVGARAARQLVETPGVSRLLVADRRRDRAELVAGAVGRTADVCEWFGDTPLPSGIDAVAAAVPGALDVAVVRHAIAAGVPCATTSDDATGLQELLALDAEARTADVAVVAGAGLAPGLSDVLARHAADALDEVDEVTVARAGIAGPASEESVRRARRDRAAEVRAGAYELAKRRVGHELVWFPDPVGARECEPVAPGVELLAAAFPGIEQVSARWAEPRTRSRLRWPARDDPEGGWAAIRVEVWGRRATAREILVYGAIERTATAAGTVLAVTTGGLVGALPDVVERRAGVHGLAAVARPRPFLAELSARGVKSAAFEGVPVA
jgi:hypothetical protein